MIVNEIVAVIGEYQPIIIDGVAYTNWAQIAAYLLVISFTTGLFSLVGRLVIKK